MLKCTFYGHMFPFDRDFDLLLERVLSEILEKDNDFTFYFYDNCGTQTEYRNLIKRMKSKYVNKNISLALVRCEYTEIVEPSRPKWLEQAMLKEDCPQWVFDIQKKENYPDWLITLIVHNNLMFPSFILDRLKLNQYDEIFALNDISINKRSTSNYRLVKWCFEHSDYVICYWYDICVRAYEQKTITYIKKDMQKKPSKYINIATSETAQTLYKELELLDVGQKQVAQKRAQGMSYREIAEELGCSPNRAKLLHSAAVKHLIKLSKDKYKKQG